MNDTHSVAVSGKKYRRIVIGFDHHAESRSVLGVAARLAVAGDLELAGIFVEDTELFGLAGLPFSTEFLLHTRRSQSFNLDCVTRELRVQVGATRHALQDAAIQVRRGFSFRTVRGRMLHTLIAEAGAGDLIMLRRADKAWPASGLHGGAHGPVAVLDPGGDTDGDVTGLARGIASDIGQDLIPMPGGEPEQIERAVRAAGVGLIVLPLALLSDPAWQRGIDGFVDRVPCAVLIASAPDSSA